MDSNHRCLGVGQVSSPLDHGTGGIVHWELGMVKERRSRMIDARPSFTILNSLFTIPMDPSGVAPEFPVCRTSVVLLDHEPDVRSPSNFRGLRDFGSLHPCSCLSGSRGTRTHKRATPATCFRDRFLIQPDDFPAGGGSPELPLEMTNRVPPQFHRVLIPHISLSKLQGDESNVRRRVQRPASYH